MKKILNFLVIFVLGIVFLSSSKTVSAREPCKFIPGVNITTDVQDEYVFGSANNKFTISVSGLAAKTSFKLVILGVNIKGQELISVSNSDGTVTFNSNSDSFKEVGNHIIDSLESNTIKDGKCSMDDMYEVVEDEITCQDIIISQTIASGTVCTFANNGCLSPDYPVNTSAKIVNRSDGSAVVGESVIQGITGGESEKDVTSNTGMINATFNALTQGGYEYYVKDDVFGPFNPQICAASFDIDPNCKCTTTGTGGGPQPVAQEPFSLCEQIPIQFTDERNKCIQCTGGYIGNEENSGVWTAIGCIKRDPQSIAQRIISLGLGMSGGVALITFLAAGFIFSTSQGDPKAYGKAKEMMTASVIGIIFVIFSVTILRFIGFEIFKIPGFGG